LLVDIKLVIQNNFSRISDEYREFAMRKSRCRQCSIYNEYKVNAQSEGNAEKPIFMFVGESPGEDEIKQMKPFIGRAGQRLRQELRKYPTIFNKKTCLISNLLSCRPLKNRFPNTDESYLDSNGIEMSADDVVELCADSWVRREIEIVRPKVIVFLGNQSLKFLTTKKGITSHRGNWFFWGRSWCFATYHPSYVIRCENMSDRLHVVKEFEADIKKVSETWHSYVNLDYRVNMSDEDAVKNEVLSFLLKECLLGPEPIR